MERRIIVPLEASRVQMSQSCSQSILCSGILQRSALQVVSSDAVFPKGASFSRLVRAELPRRRGGIDSVLLTECGLNRSEEEEEEKKRKQMSNWSG